MSVFVNGFQSGSAGLCVVKLTGYDQYTKDKTYAELKAAHTEGKHLVARWYEFEYVLDYIDNYQITFTRISSYAKSSIKISSSDEITITSYEYAQGEHSHDDYLPLAGGVMSGNIELKNATPGVTLTDTSGVGGTRLYKNASTDVDYGTYLMDTSNSDGTKDILVLNRDEKVKGKLYLRSDTEDGGSSTTYAIYGEHNTSVKLKTYSALSEIGLTTGSETIADIATNLPNNSMLVVGITTSNATVYPSNYGLLTVKRTSSTRIEFEFVTTAGKLFTAFFSITSSGNSWSDWHEYATKTDLENAGGAKVVTGSYTGNGNNSRTFTFDGKVAAIVIQRSGDNNIQYNVRLATRGMHRTAATHHSSSGSYITLTWNEQSVTLTASENSNGVSTLPNFNNNGTTYTYMAILE